MYLDDDEKAWLHCENDDLWIFNKLIIARKSGHVCGPRGIKVPKAGNYIVRPIMNILGLAENTRVVYLEDRTEGIHPGEFWCEIFEGEHLSIDYKKYVPILSVVGTKHPIHKHTRFTKWEVTDRVHPLPQFMGYIPLRYETINCEFIGGKLIEIHLRGNNFDFAHGNTSTIPWWADEPDPRPEGYRFIKAETDDDPRKGIYVR